jgi:general secretion pathway protein G
LLSSNKVSAVNSMRDLSAETFRQHLLEKYSLPPKARAGVENLAYSTLARPRRELWEATDLSAAEFADLSDYWGVVRLSLPQLLASRACLNESTACLNESSRRFLRESTIFPVRAPGGNHRLAVADPSDTAAIRAALVGPQVLSDLGESKAKAAKIQIESCSSALDLYYLDLGRYPNSNEGLAALMHSNNAVGWNGPYLRDGVVPNDPWGHGCVYRPPGEHAPFEIISLGSDGQEGGSETATDIASGTR